MDLAYVPHHGSSNYANAEFFKRVRARYYVFSGVEPSRDVFNALLEAKKTWENKDQGEKTNQTIFTLNGSNLNTGCIAEIVRKS